MANWRQLDSLGLRAVGRDLVILGRMRAFRFVVSCPSGEDDRHMGRVVEHGLIEKLKV
jgi:hypothetical protein